MIAQINMAGYLLQVREKRWQFAILFTLFILQYLFEHLLPQNRKINDLKTELKNVAIGIINILLLFIPSALLVQLMYLTEINKIGLLYLISIPVWVNIIATIFIMDLAMYWWHRINHTQSLFWRFHKFHHQDTNLNTTTALRFHIIELLFSAVFKGIFFLGMGLSFTPVIIYESLFFAVVVTHHSNIKIATGLDMQYRKLFSSPLMHRIHHSNVQEETDTNYGSVFSFWDRLFNTYKKNAAREIIFGIDEKKFNKS